MAVAIKYRLCKTCGRPAPGDYCERHQAPPRKQKRDSASKRGYDWRWRQFARRYLAVNVWCVDCRQRGRYTEANEVHHMHKLVDRPDLKYELSNLMALCTCCHAIRSARGE